MHPKAFQISENLQLTSCISIQFCEHIMNIRFWYRAIMNMQFWNAKVPSRRKGVDGSRFFQRNLLSQTLTMETVLYFFFKNHLLLVKPSCR